MIAGRSPTRGAASPTAPAGGRGALAQVERTRRRAADIDWMRTIQANLRHWLPEHRTVVPERLIGFGRHQRSLGPRRRHRRRPERVDGRRRPRLAVRLRPRLPTLRTSMVAFDTAVVDLTAALADPVDVLFGVQLGGGTDIGSALGYCQRLVTRPPTPS